MMFSALCEITADFIAIAQPASSGFDFTTLLPPLLGVLIGGLVSSATSFLLNNRSNKQQLMRDKAEYQRQKEREQIAYDRQIEREQAAYARSLKDAKRERLRSAYKVIHNAADKFRYETEQLNHTPSYVNISSEGVDEAVTEIILEDVDTDVLNTFFELRGAFLDYAVSRDSNISDHGSYTIKELNKAKSIVKEKVDELTAAMQKHLKELES